MAQRRGWASSAPLCYLKWKGSASLTIESTPHWCRNSKRKNPIVVLHHDPLLRLVEQLFSFSASRRNINLKATNGILQHRQDEPLLRLEAGLSAKVLEVLSGHKRARFEQRGDFLLRVERTRLLYRFRTLNFRCHDSPLIRNGIRRVDPWIAYCLHFSGFPFILRK